MHKPEKTRGLLMDKLETCGLRRECLPKSIGGLHEANQNWLQQRLQFEEDNGL